MDIDDMLSLRKKLSDAATPEEEAEALLAWSRAVLINDVESMQQEVLDRAIDLFLNMSRGITKKPATLTLVVDVDSLH